MSDARLFHFSDDASIARFEPRSVQIAAKRAPGQEWLNGPLVWAIDGWHSFIYLFPRDCPRVLLWPTAATTDDDRRRWMGETSARAVAFIEADWVERHRQAALYRYELGASTFEDLHDVGMWVSRVGVTPRRCDAVTDLPAALEARQVEVRVVDGLGLVKPVFATTLHVSGIRLRNARGW